MSIDDTTAFVRDLRSRVRAALADGPRSFIDIVRRCDGAYPTLVAEILRDKDFKSRKHDPLIELDTEGVLPSESVLAQLEGNPTLCSWYFTDETCARVAQMRTWINKRLAFLGAPRLFEWFVRQGVSRECVLFDADVRLLDFLRQTNEYSASQLVSYDVWDGPIKHDSRFDCVFFDPPWYPEAYPQWLARACELAPTGTIVFALFPTLRAREWISRPVNPPSHVVG